MELVEALVVSRGWEASCMLGELLHTYTLVLISTEIARILQVLKRLELRPRSSKVL